MARPVSLKNGTGNIEDRGTTGEVDIETKKSDIKVSDTNGNIKISGHGGDINVSGATGGLSIHREFFGAIPAHKMAKGARFILRRPHLTPFPLSRHIGNRPGRP